MISLERLNYFLLFAFAMLAGTGTDRLVKAPNLGIIRDRGGLCPAVSSEIC